VTRRLGQRGISVCLVLAAAALFGTIGTARVLGPPAASASVGAVRTLLGAALLLLVATAAGSATEARRLVRSPATWVAGVAQAAFQVTFLSAVELTGVAVGTLVAIGSAPILTGLLTRHTSRTWVAATALAGTGLTLLVLGGGTEGPPPDPVGVVLALGAGVSYASYTVATSHVVGRGRAPIPVAVAAFSVAALLLAPALALTDLHWLSTASGVAMVVYLAVFTTAAAYLLFTTGLRGVPAATANTLGLAEPVVATLLGVALLHERLAVAGWLGVCLVLAGLVLLGGATADGTAHPVSEAESSP